MTPRPVDTPFDGIHESIEGRGDGKRPAQDATQSSSPKRRKRDHATDTIVLIHFEIPGIRATSVPATELLPFVRDHFAGIFERSAALAIDESDIKAKLQDLAKVVNGTDDKATMLDRYGRVWRRTLVKAQKALKIELEAAEEAYKLLQRNDERESFDRDYVKSKKTRLNRADLEIARLSGLFGLLKEG